MISKQCPYFEKCNAPICPLNPDIEKAIWYSSEEICRNKEFKNLSFIINQKKIAKLNQKHVIQGFFTYTMLNRTLKIRKGISGLNENKDIDKLTKSESLWAKKHKGISDEIKAIMSENMKKVRNKRMDVKYSFEKLKT
jgi:hypothetical protein